MIIINHYKDPWSLLNNRHNRKEGRVFFVDQFDQHIFSNNYPSTLTVAYNLSQTFQVPKMEEDTKLYKLYGYGLCKGIPIAQPRPHKLRIRTFRTGEL